MIEPFDLCVAGTGPAGLSLAAACADRGVRVALIGPDPERAWPNNYGLWLDDAERLGLADHLAARWPRTEVILRGAAIDLGRGYARIANASMQSDALARCRSGGVVIHEGHVDTLVHLDGHTCVQLREGPAISARLFVDATGHASPFVEREPGPEPGFQVAWGELHAATPTELARSPEVMRFMDWTPSGAPDDGLPPSFLYCMPITDERVFVEETVLVGRPPGGDPSAWFEPLRARLHARLAMLATGVATGAATGATPLETERCIIPMGGPLPREGQRTLAFGGAAGFVHPATGYMLGVALGRLARVAEAIAEVSREPPTSIDRACGRVERSIWTASERRAWHLYGFGMQVLVELDHAGIEQFFAEFFALPPERWRGFLSATAPTSTLMATMLRYFARAAPPIRRRLSAHLFGRDGLRLARGLVRV